jgi:hypothetical protein
LLQSVHKTGVAKLDSNCKYLRFSINKYEIRELDRYNIENNLIKLKSYSCSKNFRSKLSIAVGTVINNVGKLQLTLILRRRVWNNG